MNATFPLRKSFILQGAILAGVFFVIIAVSMVVPLLLPDPDLERMPRVIISGLAAAPWVGMFLLSTYILLAGLRVKVIVHGNHVSDVGVFQRKEFDLAEVTLARWELRGHLARPRLVVIAPVGLVPFDFRVHPTAEARQLIGFFRSGLSPEIQEGWNADWEDLAVSLDCTRTFRDTLSTLWMFIRAYLLAGVGAGLICGLIAHFMFSGLIVAPYSWSGFSFVDWTVYGLALGLGFSVPLTAAALLVRCGRWLDG